MVVGGGDTHAIDGMLYWEKLVVCMANRKLIKECCIRLVTNIVYKEMLFIRRIC